VPNLSAIPGVWHATRVARTLSAAARRRAPRGIVLLYHRVAGPRRDPQWLDVTPENFAAHVGVIARVATPLALAEFERRRREGSLPPRAVAVTFDDGYADNLTAAAPLLARHGVAATVFVTAGMIGTDREFWWDDAERVAFSPRRLAPPVPGAPVTWADADGAPPADLVRDVWTIAAAGDPTPRHRLYRALCAALRPLDAARRDEAVRVLRDWAGVSAGARPTHRALDAAQLRALAAEPGITIGAHTMTHSVLSLLSARAQLAEFAQSRAALERAIGTPVLSAAYPYGTRGDVSAASMRAAREAGFDFAMANEPGAAWRWSSRWRVPRHLVRDWDAATFSAALDAWFDA
jgi:peptidoglycan/xylan/chitin deacetylase (PgdA/CDA1 family)